MDKPTREKPRIQLPGVPVSVCRGYEAVNIAREAYEFVGSFDGPVIEIRTRMQEGLLISVEAAQALLDALKLALAQPVAAEGANDAELAKMGYSRIAG